MRAVGQPEADLGGSPVDDLHRLDLVDHNARVARAEACAHPLGGDAPSGQREGINACRFTHLSSQALAAGMRLAWRATDGPSLNTSESSSTRKRPQTQCW